jgi:hypothetical protein
MSPLRHCLMMGLMVLAWPAVSQTTVTPAPAPAVKVVEREGRVIVSDQQALEAGPLSSAVLERQKLSPEVKDRLRRFDAVRDAYLKEQAQLRKKLTGAATEEERERIRSMIQDRNSDWLAQSKRLREEAQSRLRDLQRTMPDRKEILMENVRDAIRNRKGIDTPRP